MAVPSAILIFFYFAWNLPIWDWPKEPEFQPFYAMAPKIKEPDLYYINIKIHKHSPRGPHKLSALKSLKIQPYLPPPLNQGNLPWNQHKWLPYLWYKTVKNIQIYSQTTDIWPTLNLNDFLAFLLITFEMAVVYDIRNGFLIKS